MEKNWHKTFLKSEIDNEEAKEYETPNGQKIAIFNVNNEFYATEAYCTHENVSLCDGFIDGDTVECPLHQGVFSISSGKVMESPPTKDLKTYETKIEEEYVYIKLSD
tara:strand:- start:36 stop:356 length:321 start_codon:yes stop_codon:yes gene_type:complete